MYTSHENILNIYGISQNPNSKDYLMVLQAGHCEKCGKQYTDVENKWCKSCMINYLKNNFTNWTSENKKIDDFIKETQLKINGPKNIKNTIFE
jgi:methionyl-tRNA synthetase